MKILYLTLLLFPLAVVSAEDAPIRLSEPVAVTETYELFGSELPEGHEPISLAALVADSDHLAGQDVLVETEIAQVCQKKGCFFIARDGDAVARVRFKDYGFFIPTDAGGKTVLLAGQLQKVELTPEQAAHFAEDVGEQPPAGDQPIFEYQITATSVRIPLG